MTLDFWPFNCEKRRRRKEADQAYEAHLAELRLEFMKAEGIKAGVRGPDKGEQNVSGALVGGDFRPQEPMPCYECGGLFVESHLKPLLRLTVSVPRVWGKLPQIEELFYCEKCLPPVNLELVMTSSSIGGGNLDTAYFSTQEGYLQPFNFEGVEQTLIDVEDFGLLYCSNCDELINITKKRKCQKCTTRHQRK